MRVNPLFADNRLYWLRPVRAQFSCTFLHCRSFRLLSALFEAGAAPYAKVGIFIDGEERQFGVPGLRPDGPYFRKTRAVISDWVAAHSPKEGEAADGTVEK